VGQLGKPRIQRRVGGLQDRGVLGLGGWGGRSGFPDGLRVGLIDRMSIGLIDRMSVGLIDRIRVGFIEIVGRLDLIIHRLDGVRFAGLLDLVLADLLGLLHAWDGVGRGRRGIQLGIL
jgi:hypothetical protein